MADLKAFADQLVNLSVKDVNELAKILKDEYGIEPAAAAPVMMAGAAPAAAAAVEEQTEFTVFLKSHGAKKLEVVKVVKAITGMGLKEAKDLVDGGAGVIKEKISKEDAQAIRQQLEEAGAEVEVE